MDPNHSEMYVLNGKEDLNSGLKRPIDDLSEDTEQHREKVVAKSSDCEEPTASGSEGTASQAESTGDPHSGELADSPKVRLQRSIANLCHASACRDDRCQQPSCHKFRGIIAHRKRCKHKFNPFREAPKDCSLCKQLFTLCCYHAKRCETNGCPFVYCESIKKWMGRKGTNSGLCMPQR